MLNQTNKILEAIEERVKHDKATVSMVLYTYISRLTDNPLNLFLRGESGIGKTYNVTETIKILEADEENQNIWWLGAMSPTALVHSYGVLMCGEEELDLSERPEKPKQVDLGKEQYQQALDNYREIIKEWREKLKKSYYLINLSNKLLVFLEAPHIETFNKLRPLLSHDKKRISYRFTDRIGQGSLRTMHVILEGFPATIFCTTEEKYVADLATRSFTATPNLCTEKIKDAIRLTASNFTYPKTMNPHEEIKVLISKIEIKKFEPLIPFATMLGERVKLLSHRIMRDFNHFLQLLVINAIINHEERPRLNFGTEKCFLLITYEDLQQVWDTWLEIEETTLTGASGSALDIFRKLIQPFGAMVFNYHRLVEKSKEVYPTPLSSSTLRKYVSVLQDIGLVDLDSDPEDKRKKIIRVIGEEKTMWESAVSEFKTYFSLENLKEWQKETIKLCSENTDLSNIKIMNNEHQITIEDLYENHYNPQKIIIVNEPKQNTISQSQIEDKTIKEPQKETEITNTQIITQIEHFNPNLYGVGNKK